MHREQVPPVLVILRTLLIPCHVALRPLVVEKFHFFGMLLFTELDDELQPRIVRIHR
jgi:hypothetical protein